MFELQRALGQKDVERANRIVNYFEANPKNAPLAMVVPVLHAYFARVMVYQTLADKHDSAAAKAMKCSPYAVKDYARAAQSFSPAKVERIFGYLREADKKAKAGERHDLRRHVAARGGLQNLALSAGRRVWHGS